MNTNNPWVVGGWEYGREFHISRLARPNDKQTNCAREWFMKRIKIGKEYLITPFIKTFSTKEKAQEQCDALNKYE